MSQSLPEDFPIDPTTTTGTQLAEILNRFSDSVGTNNSGATPPTDTMPGMMWLDTSGGGNGVLKMRNAANTGWITLSTPGGPSVIADGSVGAPGLAFTNEPGLGWYRPAAGRIATASGGGLTSLFDTATAPATALYLYPRAAGAADIMAYNQPYGAASTLRVQLGVNAASAYLYAAGIGVAKPAIQFDASAFNFTGGQINSSGYALSGFAAGPGFNQDANNVYLAMASGWYWFYQKASGNMAWQHSTGGATIFLNSGDFQAARDVYAGGGMAMVASGGTAPYLRFTTDGWRLWYSAGNLYWVSSGGATMQRFNADGGIDIPSGAYRTANNIGIQFSNAASLTKYVALGDPGIGSQFEMTMIHQPGVWAGIRFITGGGQFQFDNAGQAHATVAGSFVALASDARIKERIEDYTPGLDAVLALRPRVFSFRPETGMDSTRRHVSLIAQEAREAMPDLVEPATLRKMGVIEHDDMLTFNMTNITYALVNAVKTLHERLMSLDPESHLKGNAQ